MTTARKLRRVPVRKRNQTIISGPQDQVDQLVSLLKPRLIKNDIVLATYTADTIPYKVALLHSTAQSALDETETFNAKLLDEAQKAGLTSIKTESNFMVTAPGSSKGNPYLWEGDPYLWEGDPYLWEGDAAPLEETPKVIPVGATHAEAMALFAAQDAFWRIQVAEAGVRRPLLNAHRGEGVLVGVFDSCPSAEELASLPGGRPAWLHLHLNGTSVTSGPYVDHGLFNTSLINFIAPSAEIHLYQVLNGEMLGETAWLIAALADFLNLAEGRPAVVNMSLGAMYSGTVSMPAVEGILKEMARRGSVICASAGNSGRRASKPAAVPQAQMPAALPYVIAVAAVNQQGARASYSQVGDIAAPGGDTVGAGPDGYDDLIGMGTTSPTGYLRMDCGTSFATPLVSGAAALVVADLVKGGAPLDADLWRRVFDRLATAAVPPTGEPGALSTTGLGAGILRVALPHE
jgi:subtilisin family serine protease